MTRSEKISEREVEKDRRKGTLRRRLFCKKKEDATQFNFRNGFMNKVVLYLVSSNSEQPIYVLFTIAINSRSLHSNLCDILCVPHHKPQEPMGDVLRYDNQ